MIEHFWLGAAVILAGGALNGRFTLPMKYTRHWHWENTRLVFALVALLILPWLLAGGLVPGVGDLFRQISGRAPQSP